jgi:di/tricarboxylate transporter
MPGTEALLVVAVAAGAMALFVTERLRADVVALCVLAALLVLRLIEPSEALFGFANSATATVACMFVLSAGLVRTGLVDYMARRIDRIAGSGEMSLILTLCLTVAVLSAIVVNTATVAIFIPVAIALARSRKIRSSRVLMPVSFASQFGGVCTLVGTSTNILVNSIAISAGLAGFGMFEFARLGVVMVAAGIIYILFIGRHMLPRRDGETQTIDKYRLTDYLAEFVVPKSSGAVGKTFGESASDTSEDLRLIKIIRGEADLWQTGREAIQPGDTLLVHGSADRLMKVKDALGLETAGDTELSDTKLSSGEVELIEALVPPQSRLVNRTIRDSALTQQWGCVVLAVQRRGRVLRKRLSRIRLEAGDSLLLQCGARQVARILKSPHLVVTNELTDLYLREDRALIALVTLLGVLVVTALNVLPVLYAALIGSLVMILAGCITIQEAYDAIDWKIIFLLGGILPLGLAMQQTGAADWLAGSTLGRASAAGPLVALAALYLVTAILTETMSNTAAAVLLAPIALAAAAGLGVSPRPFLVAITFAASTSFATPVGYQTNTMVYTAGGYRFLDFTRVGMPLNLIFWAIAVWLIPTFWPF